MWICVFIFLGSSEVVSISKYSTCSHSTVLWYRAPTFLSCRFEVLTNWSFLPTLPLGKRNMGNKTFLLCCDWQLGVNASTGWFCPLVYNLTFIYWTIRCLMAMRKPWKFHPARKAAALQSRKHSILIWSAVATWMTWNISPSSNILGTELYTLWQC